MQKLRIAAAIALTIAFFLPFSSCSTYPPPVSEGSEAAATNAEAEPSVDYAFERVDVAEPASLLIPLMFLWPWGLLWLRRRGGPQWTKPWLPLAELVLAAGTAYGITAMLIFETPLAGAYAGYAGAGLYGLTAGVGVVRRFLPRAGDDV